MKNLTAKCKAICIILAVVIILGIIIVAIKGFKVELKNRTSQEIQLYIEKDFEIEDIKQMTNEVFENQDVLIQKVEVYEDTISIIAPEITDEQKTSMVQKVNEKYGTELKAEDVDIDNIPNTELSDIVKPYIMPIMISTLIILIFIGIRYYKLGIIITILKASGAIIVSELVLFAMMAIVRIPIGRLTLPLVLILYVITLIGITNNLEKSLKEYKTEEKEEG